MSSTHEEGDTQVILQAHYAAKYKSQQVVIQANDIDIVTSQRYRHSDYVSSHNF